MSKSDENKCNISALKNIQTLLHTSIGDEVTVLNYTSSPLLPTGENYGSCMLKVDASVRRSKHSQMEELKLVAKTLPSLEYIRSRIKTAVTFEKELFAYEKLVPAYRQIERDIFSDNEEVIDLFPKFYGGHVVKDENNPDKAGENVVLLFENIMECGYCNVDRRQGLDLKHSKLATIELARFHALGVALKHRKPKIFAEAKKYSIKFPFDTVDSEYKKIIDSTIKLICQDTRVAQYENRIRNLVVPSNDWKIFQEGEVAGPWVTIIHGDFWVNNIMFRDEKDDTARVKFVDFQITRIGNPIFDLLFFLCASSNPRVSENHMDELLEVYFERFTGVLEKSGCDVSVFTKLGFERQLELLAKKMFFYSISALKFMTMDVASNLDANEVIKGVMVDGNKLFFDRSWAIINKYISKKWL